MISWEGPETLEPHFLPIGPDEDGVVTDRYPISDRDYFIGHWTAHVTIWLACQDSLEPGFYAPLPFEVVREDTLALKRPAHPVAP
jgi:hypothetical protein